MATTITNNGASIKVDNGTTIRNLMKNQIIEVSVVKSTKIKIDIGQGTLQNVYIEFADVTVPLTANVGALRDAINDMMANSVNSTSASGDASASKQDTQITHQLTELNKLDTVNTKLDTLSTALNDINFLIQQLTEINVSMDSKLFSEVMRIDESNPNAVYKGYAAPGTNPTHPNWAILKITNDSGLTTYQWADGNKNFDNVWTNRESLSFS